jgi:hypothetical protein
MQRLSHIQPLIAHTAQVVARILRKRNKRKIQDVLGEDRFVVGRKMLHKRYSFYLMIETSDHGYVLHKTYTCHTVQNTIRYDIRFTGIKVCYTIFERVTMYNNAKRTLRKLQRFISTVILL